MNDYEEMILNGLHYWKKRAGNLDDSAIVMLDSERYNLDQILKVGLRHETTRLLTVELIEKLGYFIETRGYWEDWLILLERGLVECAASLSPTSQILLPKLLYWKGFFSEQLQHYQQAITILQQVRQLAQRLDDQLLMAKALLSLGEAHRNIYQFNEASSYVEAALLLFQQQPDGDGWVANTLNSLGNIAHQQGNSDMAVDFLVRSVTLLRQDARTFYLSRALLSLAVAYTSQRDFELAHTCLSEAYKLVANSPHELQKIRILIQIGSTYDQQEKWDEAQSAFRQANTPFLQNSPDLFLNATLTHKLGDVLYKQRQLAASEAYLRQAVSLWQAQVEDNYLQLGNSLGVLGKTLAIQGKQNEADNCFIEAQRLLGKFPGNSRADKLIKEFRIHQQRLLDSSA